jgi:hypothetical protein
MKKNALKMQKGKEKRKENLKTTQVYPISSPPCLNHCTVPSANDHRQERKREKDRI